MKIGILTFHDGINHGGFFQAYSTYYFLKNAGFDVEIINYKNKHHWVNEYKAFLYTKKPLQLLRNIKKIIKFKSEQKLLCMTRFTSKWEKIPANYDAVVIGSDIVWNYEWEFLGQDPIYFGHGVKCDRLIAYAPSFGAVKCEETTIPSFVSEGLARFTKISVRDNNSQCIVKKASDRDAQLVVDPTLLVEFWGLEKTIKVKENYILVYAYQLRDSDIKQVIDIAAKRKIKIVAVGYSQPWADHNIVSVSPFEWLGYFSQAQLILTGTFHGTLFSLKYRKNFITSNNSGISNKTTTVLEKAGLMSRITEGQANFEDLFNDEIDYEIVEKNLGPWISESKQFLYNALSHENND